MGVGGVFDCPVSIRSNWIAGAAMRGRLTQRKVCTICNLLKAEYAFYRNERGNLQGRCKDCHRGVARVSAKKRYWEDRDRALTIARAKAQKYRAKRIISAVAYKRRIRAAMQEDRA
jgi:hypothetical protein